MSIENEIERTQKRLELLRKRQINKQQAAAMRFFKKNKIDQLLELPEQLEAFTKEIMPAIKNYQPKQKRTTVEDKQNE